MSRIYYFVILITLFAGASSYGQYVPDKTLVEQGDEAYNSFDNATALRHYTSAFAIDSAAYDIRLRLSRTHYDYGLDLIALDKKTEARDHFEASVRHARTLAESYPDSARAFFLLAATTGNLALFAGGREKVLIGREVESYSRHAIELDSMMAYPYVSLGIYYREVGRLSWLERLIAKTFYGALPEAEPSNILSLLHHAENLRPQFPFLQFELAKTYEEMGQLDRAIVHLEKLQALEPETTQDIRNQKDAAPMMAAMKQKRASR